MFFKFNSDYTLPGLITITLSDTKDIYYEVKPILSAMYRVKS